MSKESPVRLPVIDFSGQELKPGSHEWDLVKVQVRKALEEYGCFEALFDKVLEVRDAVFGAMEEAFDLPLETKRLYGSNKPFRGYFGATPGQFESMATDDAHILENVEQGLTGALWPQGNTSFSRTLLSFTELALQLENTIRRMILESFNLEKYMDELNDSTNYQLRFMKYGKPKTDESTLSIPAHCDSNTMTLLHQNEIDGLEIQKKDGEWLDIKPSPNSFIVMIGESFSIWLNGRLSSPFHRVAMKENKVRYSLGLFTRPKGGYIVKTPKELVDDKNPMLFKPFDHEDFLEYYSTQMAQRKLTVGPTSRLKVYCSV